MLEVCDQGLAKFDQIFRGLRAYAKIVPGQQKMGYPAQWLLQGAFSYKIVCHIFAELQDQTYRYCSVGVGEGFA